MKTVQSQVLNMLQTGQASVTELAISLGKRSTSISNALYLLKKQGKAKNVSKGIWETTGIEPQAQAKPTSSPDLNPLQIGIGIMAYIQDLQSQVTELKNCVTDRDALQTQVYDLQSKLNGIQTSGIAIPSKYF